jgi:transposase
MESTSDYWKPVFFLLEREGFDCTLYQASQVKALPGRPKTDKLDSVWLAKITERGSLAGSFVPPEEIRRLRELTRYRRLCRCRHRCRYAEARIMPRPDRAAWGLAVAGVKTSA